jgi:hypothetical protein
MLAKLLEMATGKDDLERVASKGDLGLLNKYLKTRRVFIPQKPKRFLPADKFTEEELIELMQEGAEALAGDQIEPWILEVDGKHRLPAFSSQKKMQVFSARISKELNQIFPLGCVEMLLSDLPKDLEVDYVDLNSFCPQSWEIAMRSSG